MSRNYSFSDDELIQYGNTVLEYLKSDLAAFTTMDQDLNQQKVDDLRQKVDTALFQGGDEMNKAELGFKTEVLLKEINKSRQLYGQLRYWVLKTFPNAKAIQRQFGIGRFAYVSKVQSRLILFIHELASTVAQYRVELEAVGTPVDLLDSIASQAEVLTQAETVQEAAKGSRMVSTAERKQLLNDIYDDLREFNAAAEYVFFTEPAKRERYRAPSGVATVEEDVSL